MYANDVAVASFEELTAPLIGSGPGWEQCWKPGGTSPTAWRRSSTP